MLKTNNKTMETVLDLVLGTDNDNRRLLMTGQERGSMHMILFSDDGIKMLESQLADARRNVDNIQQALTLSRLGLTLGCEVTEEPNKR